MPQAEPEARMARPRPARISAVISDVDGTMVTDDKTLSDAARAAVAGLRARGIAFAIVSSRPPRGLIGLIEALDITTVVAGFNGGVVATPGLSVLEQHLLAPDTARQAVERLDAQGVQAWVFHGADWLLRQTAAPHVDHERKTVSFEPLLVKDFGPALDGAAKIVGVSDDFELLNRCEADVAAALSDRANVVRSQRYYLDITHPLANKGEAVTAMAKVMGVPLAEIAVLGDGANDVPMFARAGLSIAMGNAAPAVQAAADLVTTGNNEDGFAQALERWILA